MRSARSLLLLLLVLAASVPSAPARAALGGVPIPEGMLIQWFPPCWSPSEAKLIRGYLLAGGVRVEQLGTRIWRTAPQHVGWAVPRYAVLAPAEMIFKRVITHGVPDTLHASEFVSQQIHGQQHHARNPLQVTQFNSRGYWVGPGKNSHIKNAIARVVHAGGVPDLRFATAAELAEMGMLVEIDQETLLAVRNATMRDGSYSVVVRDHGQGMRLDYVAAETERLERTRPWRRAGAVLGKVIFGPVTMGLMLATLVGLKASRDPGDAARFAAEATAFAGGTHLALKGAKRFGYGRAVAGFARAAPVIGWVALASDLILEGGNVYYGVNAGWGDVWNAWTGQLDAAVREAGLVPPAADQDAYVD